MVAIPSRPEDALAERVYETYERREADRRRGEVYLARLGASSIGAPCLRSVFLDWRAYSRRVIPGRILRLFQTGHIQEKRVIDDLRAAGLAVWDLDPATGKQYTYTDKTGHLVDKIDGVVKGVPGAEKTAHLLEIKTHNDKRWTALNKAQSVQQAEPEHHVQCHIGMWLTGLRRTLYVGINKNDENYYFERVRWDPAAGEEAKARVDTLYNATLIPAGISADATAWACTFCDQKEACLGAQPLKTCRSCRHVEPGADGTWLCNLWQSVLSWDEQRKACPEYSALKAEPLAPGTRS